MQGAFHATLPSSFSPPLDPALHPSPPHSLLPPSLRLPACYAMPSTSAAYGAMRFLRRSV
eukprot:3198453-Rhodomonas_salina.1